MPKLGLSVYGGVGWETSRNVSGLTGYQAQFISLVTSFGIDVVPIYFQEAKGAGDSGSYRPSGEGHHIFMSRRKDRRPYLPMEARSAGLAYPEAGARLADELAALYRSERLDALHIIEWLPAGMAVWDSALRSDFPVSFTPTEHGAICHYGFLLHNCGSPCEGPGDGAKCGRCTHSLEPYPPTRSVEDPWYSRRHRAFHRLTRWAPRPARQRLLHILSENLQHPGAAISEREGKARLASARRFLNSKQVTVAYQSPHQHRIFERATGLSLPAPLPKITPTLFRPFQYQEKTVRNAGSVNFLFAARPNFDRGLWFLLDAWKQWAPPAAKARLHIYTHADGAWLDRAVEDISRSNSNIVLCYGKLGRRELQKIHQQMHFVINPAVWEEPGSATVNEGYALGTPAIVPTCTGSADYLQDGRNGYLYEFRDVDSLVDTLERAVDQIGGWNDLSRASLATAELYRELSLQHLEKWCSLVLPGFRPNLSALTDLVPKSVN
jgi:glycosyltransferase involved in cell wall biosynthesis